jgi:predicted glycosyltransferase
MNILIDIGHPAHVHLFKHFAREMTARGHQVHFTCRSREFVTGLLQHEGFTFTSFGPNYTSAAGKLWGLLRFTWLLLRAGLQFKPDILLSHSSMYAAFVAFLLRKPHLSFEDTFNFEQIRLYKPFTSAILTGTYDHPLKSKKVVRYPGYHELAYLPPNRFTPDPSVLSELFPQSPQNQYVQSKLGSARSASDHTDQSAHGSARSASAEAASLPNYNLSSPHDSAPSASDEAASSNTKHKKSILSEAMHRACRSVEVQNTEHRTPNPKFIILRFVSWSASHDIGHKGMTLESKIAAVKAFSEHAQVFISSESPLPPELQPYRFPLPPQRMHHAIAFASLIFGESATMASEAAVLGIPAIYLDNTGRLYTKEQQEKYGLVFNYTESEEDQQKALAKGVELLTTPGIKEEWQEKREKMLAEKIDVTRWLVDFIEAFHKNGRIR